MEIDIPRPSVVVPAKVLVAFRPLVPRIARQHALQAHANALHALHRAPSGLVEEIQAYDAVAVDVRVDGNLARRPVFPWYAGDEHDLRGFDGVFRTEAEAEAIGFVEVQWVRVENLDF